MPTLPLPLPLPLPPLLGFVKWLECLEIGFREVFRGLVSPTPFMEDCVKRPSWCTWLEQLEDDRFYVKVLGIVLLLELGIEATHIILAWNVC